MARWHLVTERGSIVRSVEAESVGEARFRLAPIRKGQSVLSAASYRDQPKTPERVKDASKARVLTGAHRRAIAQANTRRMAERKGWVPKNREAVYAKNRRHYRKQMERNPRYAWSLHEARRREAAARHKDIAGMVVALCAKGLTDKQVADRVGVAEQVVNDIRQCFNVPDSVEQQRRKRQVLKWYYREVCGLSYLEIQRRTGIHPKFLRTLRSPFEG